MGDTSKFNKQSFLRNIHQLCTCITVTELYSFCSSSPKPTAQAGARLLAMATSPPKKATSSQQAASSSSDPAQNSEQPAGVNRKKQKRREKQAAKLAASQAQAPTGSHPHNGVTHSKNGSTSQVKSTASYEHVNGVHANHSREDEDLFYSDEELD